MKYYIDVDDEKMKNTLPEIENVMEYLHNMALYFQYHNKNLTKNQWYFVDSLMTIFNNSINFGKLK